MKQKPKLTVKGLKRLIKIYETVSYEHKTEPYDRIPWAVEVDADERETLRRFYEE